MSNKTLTDAQNAIISSESDKILVSASAGTGKTFVMVERIIDLLTNKGEDIDNFLIVTFTKASAEEMRGRIRSALKEELIDHLNLKYQLKKLSTASISTLHSFCNDLIKRYFYAADLPPKFKVLDDVKASVMKREAIEDLIDDLYLIEDDDFLRLSEIFSAKRRDDGLMESVIKVFNYAQSLEDPEDFISRSKSLKTAKSYFSVFSNEFNSFLDNAEKELYSCNFGLKEDNFTDLVKDCENIISFINKASEIKEFNDKVNFLNKNLAGKRIPSTSKDKKNYNSENYAKTRKMFIEELKSYKAIVDMSYDAKSLDKISVDVETFCEIVEQFSEYYRKAKDASSYLDFADLEHYALKLLSKPEIIKDIREKYKYVFVDEYQDTSKVQEALIQAISKSNKLFVVGDLKQSIYGFRQCDMTIFAEKENTYGKTTPGEVHYLNSNFRSGGKILKFVNELFSDIMTKEVGIDYAANSRFESTRPDFGKVELDVITVKKEREEAKPVVYSVYEDDEVDTELKTGEIEGQFIAKKIKELVGQEFYDGKVYRKIKYDDICILSRDISSVKSTNIYKAILNKGIPVTASSSGTNLFDYAEVVQAASFINILQNYKNDIPLLSVLKSPFFSFTDNDLIAIKQNAPKAKFFHEAFLSAKATGILANKVNDFFSTIDNYRAVSLARGAIYALKKAIYETDFEMVTLSKFNGKKKLELVFDFISKLSSICEDGNLAGTVKAIEILSEDNLKAADTISSDGAVAFMTIHKSKGLEFPIVFLSNLAKKSHNITDAILCDKELGIAIKDYDLDSRRKKNSLPFAAITAKKTREEMEENLRVLYVAMTRAKAMLFMTGIVRYSDEAPKSLHEAFLSDDKQASDNLSLIGKSLAKNNSYCDIAFVDGDRQKTLPIKHTIDKSLCLPYAEKAIDDVIDYCYQYKIDTVLPTKFAASNLKRDYFVEEEVSYKLPDLYLEEYSQNDSFSNDKLEKKAIGTAYHKLLDLSKPLATYETVKRSLDLAVENHDIDKDISKVLDLNAVQKALNLPIMSFGKAYTEKPFMMKVPANLFTEYDTKSEVLLQGIIDLLLVSGDDAIVIDYKYSSETNSAILRSRYKKQLEAYAYAVEKGLPLNVKKKYILNLRNFELIEV